MIELAEQRSTTTAGRRDVGNWSPLVSRLTTPVAPPEAWNINVAGRRLIGAQQGFGQLWQKTYQVSLPASVVTPAGLIRIWKERFEAFWPAGNKFYGALTRISPGEVALLNIHVLPGPIKLSTGVLVIYADDTSFSFMNPEGHMFAGWITFSAYEDDAATVAQVQVLVRASDPVWDVVMRLFGAYRQEDRFWVTTLRQLGAFFGVADAAVDTRAALLDPRVQWSRVLNVWRNAAIRSGLYWLSRLARFVLRELREILQP